MKPLHYLGPTQSKAWHLWLFTDTFLSSVTQNRLLSQFGSVALEERKDTFSCKTPHLVRWWPMPVVPAFQKLRQEDGEFQTMLGYTVKHCLKKPSCNNSGISTQLFGVIKKRMTVQSYMFSLYLWTPI